MHTATRSRYTTTYAAQRFAYPFYVPSPPDKRVPYHGLTRMVDWSKKQLGPLDRRHGNRIVELKTVIGEAGVREIEQVGRIKLHSLGDSGVNHAEKAEVISDKMSNDYKPTAGGSNPAFLFHLGDV